MKTAIPILLVLAGAGALVGPLLLAQQTNPPAPPKVAVVNVRAVFRENPRAKSLQVELDEALKPYKLQAEKLVKEIDTLTASKTPNAPLLAKKKGEWEAVNTQILQIIAKKHEEKLPAVWNEINALIDAAASHYEFKAVFGYGDPDDADLQKFQGVKGSKLRTTDMGCTATVYAHNSIDITPVLLQMQKERR